MRDRKAANRRADAGSATRLSSRRPPPALARSLSLCFFFLLLNIRTNADSPSFLSPPPFLENVLQGLGYTDEDSAGQSNIFAVEVESRLFW